MANSVYPVNKGINKSVEFKGLRAQYIWYLGAGILALMVLYGTMYILGIPSLICVPVIIAAGTGVVMKVYGLNGKYGEHGMMKEMAKRKIPRVIKCNSRKVFTRIGKIGRAAEGSSDKGR